MPREAFRSSSPTATTRICASYHLDEDEPVACRIVDLAVSIAPWLSSSTRWCGSPIRSGAARFYEALGFEFERDMDIVRNGELEATNYFFGIGDQKAVLELTYNHDGRTYELGTGYGHIALAVDDMAATLAELAEQGIEPEREPYRLREGGSLSALCAIRISTGSS